MFDSFSMDASDVDEINFARDIEYETSQTREDTTNITIKSNQGGTNREHLPVTDLVTEK